MNNKKLDFYLIDNKYIDYLSKYDKHIAYNKDFKRPYIGIVFEINNYSYFAPMFSPKEKHKKYRDNYSFFRIYDIKNKKSLGIIRFSDMIPVPSKYISLLNYNECKIGYKRMLSEQYSFINITKNRNQILFKANTLYKIVTRKRNRKSDKFYRKISCSFKILEILCDTCKNL